MLCHNIFLYNKPLAVPSIIITIIPRFASTSKIKRKCHLDFLFFLLNCLNFAIYIYVWKASLIFYQCACCKVSNQKVFGWPYNSVLFQIVFEKVVTWFLNFIWNKFPGGWKCEPNVFPRLYPLPLILITERRKRNWYSVGNAPLRCLCSNDYEWHRLASYTAYLTEHRIFQLRINYNFNLQDSTEIYPDLGENFSNIKCTPFFTYPNHYLQVLPISVIQNQAGSQYGQYYYLL